jgi:hypothetical protein
MLVLLVAHSHTVEEPEDIVDDDDDDLETSLSLDG